jgi:hypothetical protein
MFDYGLTTVNDAGLDPDINLMDSLQKAKLMKLNVYAMITANQKNIDLYLKKEFTKQIIECAFIQDVRRWCTGFAWRLYAQTIFKPDQYGALLA